MQKRLKYRHACATHVHVLLAYKRQTEEAYIVQTICDLRRLLSDAILLVALLLTPFKNPLKTKMEICKSSAHLPAALRTRPFVCISLESHL